MEAKQPISFRCENKAEMKAAYLWLLQNGYLDQRWGKEGSIYPLRYPYMIGVYKDGRVMRGLGFGRYLNTQPASSLLVTEVFKAIKRHDHEIHV